MSRQNSLLVTAIALSSTLTVTMAALSPAAAQSQVSDVSIKLPTEAAVQITDAQKDDSSVAVEAVSTEDVVSADIPAEIDNTVNEAVPEALGEASPTVELPVDSLVEPPTEVVEQPAEDVPDLLMAIAENGDQTAQQAAVDTLIETGEAAVPELTAALAADSAETRAIAAYTLSEIGPDAAAATPALLNSLRDDDELVRALATSALTNIGLERPTLINVLIAAIRNEPGLVKAVAADALVQIGSDAVPALSDLLVNDTVSSVAKQAAATIISDIGLSSPVSDAVLQVAVPTLRAALGQNNAVTQLYAADALWTLTENRDLVLPTLVTAAASSDHKARDLATVGLAYLGRQVLPAVPLLNQVIGHQEAHPRNIAQTALGVVVNSGPVSALGIIARESPRLLRTVPAVVRAVTRLWR
ncbi:MAG: HEAT repeat domain-containing protein [Phormidesmis sp.]